MRTRQEAASSTRTSRSSSNGRSDLLTKTEGSSKQGKTSKKKAAISAYFSVATGLVFLLWLRQNYHGETDERFDIDGWPLILPIFDGETTDEISCKMCTQREFSSPWFKTAIGEIGETSRNHRKQWELAYVVHLVKTLKLCKPGKQGLVLAVGKEKLPQFFASMGCTILATDLPVDDDPNFVNAWANTGQHSAAIESLYVKDYKGVTEEKFKELVTYHPENMNSFSDWIFEQEKFDFVWSLCSIEHVGSIELGQNVVLRTLDLLKPGGVAFHSVEFNLSSNIVTKETKGESIWRKQDFDVLKQKAIAKGMKVFPVQFGAGHGDLDRNPDGKLGSYSSSDHIKLYDTSPDWKLIKTSFAMIIQKLKE